MIGIDWGTSNLRAYRFAAEGSVAAARRSSRGVATIGDGDFEGVLADLLGDWLADAPDILMAGMVGSRSGWVETPYLPCPADPHALAGALVEVPTRLGRCRIVPGLSVAPGADKSGDVMRGEETQIVGAGLDDGWVVLPGTHSKWARLSGGRIDHFRTAMTGELYALLLGQSLLGKLADPAADVDDTAFSRGVARSLADPSLVMTLFSARADVLLGDLVPGAVASYLSGLLIGAEVATMAPHDATITLVGDGALVALYRHALAQAGATAVTVRDGAEAVARGLWTIGRQAA